MRSSATGYGLRRLSEKFRLILEAIAKQKGVKLPCPPESREPRDGWDKDSDFHVAAGTQIEPLPFHGMNDQLYAQEKRPQFPSDALHRKYNTRWVEGRVLKQNAKR